MNYKDISPTELAARLKRGDAIHFIDVREPEEYEVAHIEEAELLPLSNFYAWSRTLDTEEEIVIVCHHGIRSAHACELLAREGFKKLNNLTGGIDLWSQEVDPNVPRY
jgi:rhodanese-related sulfurtransferase